MKVKDLKVGDFVRGSLFGTDFIGIVNYISEDTGNINVHYTYVKSGIKSADWFIADRLTLWHPIKGEKIWFWDKCTPHRPTLREFGGIMKDGDGQGWYYTDSQQNPYELCEPFLYEYPTIFKRKETGNEDVQ